MAEFGRIEWISGEDPYSDVKTIQAIPSSGYSFVRWHGDIGPDSTANPLTIAFTGESTYKIVTALFKQDQQYLLAIDQQSTYGTAEIREFAGYPSHKQVTAEAVLGYVFSHWEGDYITNANKTDNPLQVYMLPSKPTAYLHPVFVDDLRCTKITSRDGSQKRVLVDGQLTQSSMGYDDSIVGDQRYVVEVTIGTVVDSIGDRCFKEFTALSSVQFSQDIQSIGEEAFYNCQALQEFDFSKARALGTRAFCKSGLTSVASINSSITALPNECFNQCGQLRSIVIQPPIESIGADCFSQCQQLTSIDLREYTATIPSIQSSTFDPVGQVAGRTIYFKTVDETQLAYDNAVWSPLYDDFYPQLATSTVLEYNVARNSTISCTIYRMGGYSSTTIDFGDGQTEEYTKMTSKVTHKYRSAYSPAIVEIDNTLTALYLRDSKLTAIQKIGQNVALLKENALSGTSIASFQIPKSVLSVENPLMQKASIADLPTITSQGGASIGQNWIVLASGRLVNVFGLSTPTSFNASTTAILKHLTQKCFSKCTSLASISLPSSIQSAQLPLVSKDGLPSLTSLRIQSGGAFSVQNGMLLSDSGEVCMTIHTPGALPATAKSIGQFAFTNTSLASIVIPTTIQRMSGYALCNNCSLAQVTLQGKTKSEAQELLESTSFIYGGPDYVQIHYEYEDVIVDDYKKQVKDLAIVCTDGSIPYVAVTDESGYIKKDLQPAKVLCLTVTNEYARTSNPLPGMTNDSDKLEALLAGFAQVTKLKNSAATKSAVKSKITEMISTLESSYGDEGLFIFHDGGHGGNDERSDAQYMCLYDGNLYDYEFWELVKSARCRIMAIFCTCHSGTMFRAPSLDEFNNRKMLMADSSSSGGEDDDSILKQKGWATSAQEYFNDMPSYDPERAVPTLASTRGLLKAEAPEDFEPRLCVYAACSDSEVSLMEPGVGHLFILSIVHNFERNSKLDSYKSLFDNSTTRKEFSRYPNPDDLHPQYYVSSGFNDSTRVFT